MNALRIEHITKTFVQPNGTALNALDDVSFVVEEGEIHGLLGPNGAGKSTLISLMSGITRPTSGTIEVCGVDVVAAPLQTKQMLGIVPQELVVEMAFTIYEVLYYFSGMYGVPAHERKDRIDHVLNDLDLFDKRNERARGLSGGMKRRLMIAKAILHKPKVLVLDEPTAGVDVALRQKIWALSRRLQQEGTTIIFTTHYLEEVEKMCNKITLIHRGRVIKDGTLADIKKEFTKENGTASLEDIFLELTGT